MEPDPERLARGRLVQINPETAANKAFAGCIMVVTEIRAWGAIGYVQALGNEATQPGDQYFYRAGWEEMELVGIAAWVIDSNKP